MYTLMQGTELIADLFPVFLINKTDDIFVTSDNFVCLYNYVKLKKHGTLGLQSPGLQIFCPLTKNLVLLLIDKIYYHIDLDENRNEKEGIVYINNSSDIDAINKLQLFNCNENIIYSDERYQKHIIKLHSEVEKLLPNNFFELTPFSENQSIDVECYGYRISQKTIELRLKFSFIKLNHQKNKELKEKIRRVDKLDIPIKLKRDPQICEMNEKRFNHIFYNR